MNTLELADELCSHVTIISTFWAIQGYLHDRNLGECGYSRERSSGYLGPMKVLSVIDIIPGENDMMLRFIRVVPPVTYIVVDNSSRTVWRDSCVQHDE